MCKKEKERKEKFTAVNLKEEKKKENKRRKLKRAVTPTRYALEYWSLVDFCRVAPSASDGVFQLILARTVDTIEINELEIPNKV